MKKPLLILLLSAVISIANAVVASENTTQKRVFISQVVEHPALNVTTQGIIAGLEKNGFKRNANLEVRVESAQASVPLAAQIATKFVTQKPDVVVGVGTISAQSFVNYVIKNEAKLVFSSVTDPIAAALVKKLDNPGYNISGVSNFVALEPQLKLFQQIQPKLRRLGIVYNPGEINSITIVKRLEELCVKLDITLIKQTANKTADVAQAATKLAGAVDAIFISNDNTALSALQSVVNAANKVKVPVYVSDTDAVKLGALAALGPNQYQVGLQTGKMVARCLRGENLNAMPVEFPSKTDLYINSGVAKVLGITIPNDISARATEVISSGNSS